MFECAEEMLIQLIPFIPGFLGVWLVFDFIGMLFDRR